MKIHKMQHGEYAEELGKDVQEIIYEVYSRETTIEKVQEEYEELQRTPGGDAYQRRFGY